MEQYSDGSLSRPYYLNNCDSGALHEQTNTRVNMESAPPTGGTTCRLTTPLLADGAAVKTHELMPREKESAPVVRDVDCRDRPEVSSRAETRPAGVIPQSETLFC